ncbi:MAG: serine protease [Euryarchaeota archaeon]|nr:serine protease [Euryarchaeota archaeon]
MGRAERLNILHEIEQERGCRVLTFVTGDRRGLEARIAPDSFPFCLEHLGQMGHQEQIDLYLYSTGGMTMAGFALVNLIREFCDVFNVIIPFKAHSCATLIALGADNIYMTKMGQLSPIDPSVTHSLGPHTSIPGQQAKLVPVNVEDVSSYFDLAQKELGLNDNESLVKVFERLSRNVHPLTLGAINRSREQISFLAKKLLSYHTKDQAEIDKIVETLIRGRFSHDYLIGHKEAKEVLGLKIRDMSDTLSRRVMELYQEYDKLLQLSVPYNPEIVLGDKEIATGVFNQAIIESGNLTHVFRTVKEVKRVSLEPPMVPLPTVGCQERIISVNWLEDNTV